MNLVQITPGAGGMYCGGCFRDNALVAALRRKGHNTLMVPLYLPLTLDEENQVAGTSLFFGGINVYLQQKLPFFRGIPGWLHSLLNSPALLRWATGSAAKTRAEEVGDLTLSMLRGEEGNQVRELDELIGWLRTQGRPDVICLSNVLLVGLARRLRTELQAPVCCLLSGEDAFVDSLPPRQRQAAWETLRKRCEDLALCIAPSRYYAEQMRERLHLPAARLRVVPNGINLAGFEPTAFPVDPPVIGYFARMCREKGLDTFVQAVIQLRERGRVGRFRVKIGGGMGPSDKPVVDQCRAQLEAAGLLQDVEFHPNLTRQQKVDFYRSLSLFSVPALYGESFGLYLVEALAAGVPVVQPRHAAFPELVEATGGGRICDPTPEGLALGMEELLLAPERARSLGQKGREAVLERYSIERMAEELLGIFQEAMSGPAPLAVNPSAGVSRI